MVWVSQVPVWDDDIVISLAKGVEAEFEPQMIYRAYSSDGFYTGEWHQQARNIILLDKYGREKHVLDIL
ncbi:hypothetical protein Bca4012_021038 [Brassica carinata]